jgi:GNAT superfamily N-acetyltransferase
MKQELTLLRVHPEHADTLTRIAIASKRHWGYPERWIEIWTPKLTITPEYILANETWLVSINDEPVGFYSLKQANGTLWLAHLWLLPAFIGQGLGAFLFRHALTRSRKQGASMLKIESDPNAASFYQKMGAQKVGERRDEVDGQPRVLPVLQVNL